MQLFFCVPFNPPSLSPHPSAASLSACARSPRRARRPNGYWKSLENVRAEVDAFNSEYGLASAAMPTAAALRRAGRRDLLNAISNAGGFRAVGEKLGLASARERRKPRGYWKVEENVVMETRRFVNMHLEMLTREGGSVRLPTGAELREAGRADLESGISEYGGWRKLAKVMKMEQLGTQREPGFWKDFARLEEALREFVMERDAVASLRIDSNLDSAGPKAGGGIMEAFKGQQTITAAGNQEKHTVMPSQRELRDSGRADLAQAITEFHGGFPAVSVRMGFQRRSKNYDEFWMLAKELFHFCFEEFGNLPVMPTSAVLKEKKRLDLLTAIVKHGGMASVAERLGLVYVVRTREAFRDWDVFRRSLMAFTQTHGVPGMLPTSRELRNFERPDIYQGILYWGGPRVVADLTGLKVDIYWQHFHCVGAQVLSFIDTHGVPGVMPTEAEFLCVGQRTLNLAASKFGYSQVAGRLGLTEPPQISQAAFDTMLGSVLNIYDDLESLEEDSDIGSGAAANIRGSDPLAGSSLSLDDLNLDSLR